MQTITRFHGQQDTDEMAYLAQVIDVDGYDATVLDERPVTNGSGRLVGTEYTVSDETASFIAECIEATA